MHGVIRTWLWVARGDAPHALAHAAYVLRAGSQNPVVLVHERREAIEDVGKELLDNGLIVHVDDELARLLAEQAWQ
jgi:hypothetical protein